MQSTFDLPKGLAFIQAHLNLSVLWFESNRVNPLALCSVAYGPARHAGGFTAVCIVFVTTTPCYHRSISVIVNQLPGVGGRCRKDVGHKSRHSGTSLSVVPPCIVVPCSCRLLFTTMAKSQARPLAAQAKRSYLHFIWGLSFGIVSVLATPLVAAAGMLLLAYKNTHDLYMYRKQL